MSPFPFLRARHRASYFAAVGVGLAGIVSIAAPLIIRKVSAARAGSQALLQSRPAQTQFTANYGKLPLSFEKNAGQVGRDVEFLSRGPGYDLFLMGTRAVLSLRKPKPIAAASQLSSTPQTQTELASLLYLEMLGANRRATIKGADELPGKINYFVGNDPSDWHTNIPTYRKVEYTDIFPGVNLVYYGNQTQLEYDFVLAPGAKVDSVRFRIDGADSIKVGREGELRLATGQGEVQLRAPQIYQLDENGGRTQIKGSYLIKGSEIGFKVANFDRKRPLIIDPVLSYSTLLGSGGSEQGNSIAVDSQGNAYITGVTNVSNFPTTAGAFQTTGVSAGAFVTKLDPTGSTLIYSTYLAGSFSTSGNGIAVDSAGNAYVTGNTSSADFPLMNPLRGGRNNLLITTDSGANWAPSNIGTENKSIQTLAIDKNSPSTIYAGAGLSGGIFKSTDGGATWTALNTGLTNASCPALVIDSSSSNILYAGLTAQNFGSGTGLYKSVDGGNTWASSGFNGTQISSLAVDPQNNLTVYAGTTFGLSKSTNGGASWANANTGINFGSPGAIVIDPTTPTTLYTIAGGGGVFKSTNGAANWSPVNNGLPGTPTSIALAMDPTATSTLYVGTAASGVFKTTNAGANWAPVNTGLSLSTANMSSLAIVPTSTATVFAGTVDGRIFKTTNAGGSWSVVYVTTTNTGIRALAIDAGSPAKVIAGVSSTGQTLDSPDAFVTKLNPSGSALLYSTFIGGLLSDQANAIAIDASGNACIAGFTSSSDYPTANAHQPSFNGPTGCSVSGDAFITKLNSSGSALSFSTYLGGTSCETARAITLDSSGNVYVAGETFSANLATPGAFQTAPVSGRDAFAARFSTNGALGYFTYLGGNGDEIGYGIATDSSGNAYVTGLTTSTNYPTANPIQATNGGSAGDVFVTKLNSTGSGLVYSTYLGGTSIESGRGIAVDSAGSAYVTGVTGSLEFPLVAGALRTKSPFFRSTDGGGTFNNDNYGFKASNIITIAVNPVSPSTVFAGSTGKIQKSTDGGRNWTPNMTGLVNPTVRAIAINPANPAIMYLASDNTADSSASHGVFKSTDGGNSWNPVNNGLGVTPQATYLAIDPITPSTLYAGGFGSLYKSIDSGGTWNKIGPPVFSAVVLVIDPVTPTTLYSGNNGSGDKVLKSTDGGANWQVISNGYTGSGVSFIAVDPQTPATVYASGFNGGLFKTVNGGAQWTSLNPGLGGPIAIDPLNPSIIYGSDSGAGVSKSTNGGSTFTALSKAPALIFSVVINPITTTTLYAVGSPGDEDAFVSKLSPSGTSFIYSTLLGGTRGPQDSLNYNDIAFAIALDSTGNAYVTGVTRSPDFPAGPNSYQPFNRGFDDAFVAKLSASYIISGQVLDTNNAPVGGAEVNVVDGSSLISTVTEADGSYEFSRLREGGSFTVSATKPHFTMSPASQSFNNLTSNQTLNFTATATNAPFFTVGGQITDNGSPLSGVTVTLSGSQQSIRTTDGSGNYSFTLAGGGNYTVTPSRVGFTFSPANQTLSNLSANETANFSSTRQNFVVINANNHGTGSLRQAILDANATPGLDTITFNIPGGGVQTINLLIGLPAITDPVILDATTQPGYAGAPRVELNGSQTGSNAIGLDVTSGNSTIRGLAIGGFSGMPGIRLSTNGGNTIQANYVGIDATGASTRRNNVGISITLGSANNLIGGTTAAARNVISGNSGAGVAVGGANNQIQGNFIGTNASGSAALGNTNGIEITGSAQFINNLIGGTLAGAGNLISGNANAGINMGPGNTVQGNLIGTDATGLKSVPNGAGINATGGGNNLIGGVAPGARNVISGNSGDGVTVGGTGTLVQGNFIGVDITGAAALGNGGTGVSTTLNGAVIGGTVAAARNIISGNSGFGNISLGANSSPSTVQGNYIGTDVTGSVALINPKPGISIQSSSHVVGGTTAAAGNVISGNTVGIEIGGNVTGAVSSNVVQGNYIGVNQAGTGSLPNASDGIRLTNLSSTPAANNIIGGVAAGAGNRIAFNGGNGVLVLSGTGNSIRGNSIASNGGMGIDLAPVGITSNDAGDGDTGANNRQNFPSINSVTPGPNPPVIKGTLNSTPNTTFQIDFYSSPTCDLSGVGEGDQFLGTAMVTTAADGNAAIDFTTTSAVSAGAVITATATDPAGNTSEFSTCAAAAVNLISFSQANYSVPEGGGMVTINVVRSGDTSTNTKVDYATSDGTASQVSCATANGLASSKCDFTTALGTLTFAAGETSRSFNVLISQDIYVEGPETFTVSLANPAIGAALGSVPSAVVTINDDASEPAQNPLDDARAFVIQHYHDFLNREPDQSGLDFWTNQITSCGSDVQCTEVRRIDVSASFFLSIEFQQSGYLVERFYKTAYGNATGTSTFGSNHQLAVPIVRFDEFLRDTQRIGQGVIVLQPGWEQVLENNKQAYAAEFVVTSRFVNAFPASMTPTAFVDKLNQNAGNALSLNERTAAIGLFGGASSTSNLSARAQAMRLVAEDTDLYSAEYNRAFVLAQFFGYLRRNPNDPQDTDYTGYDFWLTKLNQFNGNYIQAEMVKAFLSSIEYRQRFGP